MCETKSLNQRLYAIGSVGTACQVRLEVDPESAESRGEKHKARKWQFGRYKGQFLKAGKDSQ